MASGFVTVVDLDRAAPGDPAQDVGDFLQRLRANIAQAGLGVEAADRATETFLEEYERSGGAELVGLNYYWSFSVLHRLLGSVRNGRTRRIEYYRSEFHGIPNASAAYGAADQAAIESRNPSKTPLRKSW